VDASVVVALISSSASLVIAGATTAWSARQNTRARAAQADLEVLKHQLETNARAEERRLTMKAQLDPYRESLLVAVDDLGNRIDNIRHKGFLAYLKVVGPRQETALLSSLYRFARYFGRLELLYRDLNVMRFERDEDTKVVAGLLAEIGGTFASDRHGGLMLWREEQRAIGELICRRTEIAGYSTFVEDYETHYRRWLGTFAEELALPRAAETPRLRILQDLLAKLAIQLDEPAFLVGRDESGRPASPPWLVRAVEESADQAAWG
jgi:hypothetical protein